LAAGAFGDKSAGGHELTDLGAFALGAGGAFLAEYQTLELTAAAFTAVLENGHLGDSLLSEIINN
jgi:hypothetical protein